jgi:opacity protein-like surface antigen
MKLKRLLTFAILNLFFSISMHAQSCCEEQPCGKFYLKLASGASFSEKLKVVAPIAIWDPAVEGYRARIGTRPILGAAIGYDFGRFLATDLEFSYRPAFKYKKFQTSIANDTTAAQIGNKTRHFNLDVSSIMYSVYLNGYESFSWRPQCSVGALYPVLGAGVGVSQLKIYNFRSSGLPDTGDNVPGFGSDNEYTKRYHFTYQVMVGLEYRYGETWALSAGYRWFDAGKFKGPSYIRNPAGLGQDVRPHEWRMKFRSNEAFVEFKVFI